MTISVSKLFISLLLLGLIVTVVGCGSVANQYVPPPPPEVTVARPVQRMVTPFVEENGVIEAVDEAEVRARVQGFVEQVKFQPGDQVSAGDLLYQIESDQYQAIVNSAKAMVQSADAAISAANAMVATAEAEVKVSDQNLRREKTLMDRQAGSQSDFDAAVAARDSALAALDSAKANVGVAIAEKGRAVASLAQTQLDLDYTTVESPIGGRISITVVKRGNLVENGTKLATVVDRKNVFVNFSISDRDMLRFIQERREKLQPGEDFEEPDLSQFPVYMQREVDQGFPFAGSLDYVDQEGVDASTGTFGMRALFENKDDLLFPGLFVTVRVPTADAREQMLIPELAILRDQTGQYVLTIDDQRKIARTPVLISQTISGWAIVESGLDADSQFVVDGLQRARPGLEVSATVRELKVDDTMLLRGLTPSGASSDADVANEPAGD